MWLVLDSTALDQGFSGIEQVDVKRSFASDRKSGR